MLRIGCTACRRPCSMRSPEVAAVEIRIAAGGPFPVGHRVGVEEKRHHGAEPADRDRDPGLASRVFKAHRELRREPFELVVGIGVAENLAGSRFPAAVANGLPLSRAGLKDLARGQASGP